MPGLHKHQQLWRKGLSPFTVPWLILTLAVESGGGVAPSAFPCPSCGDGAAARRAGISRRLQLLWYAKDSPDEA